MPWELTGPVPALRGTEPACGAARHGQSLTHVDAGAGQPVPGHYGLDRRAEVASDTTEGVTPLHNIDDAGLRLRARVRVNGAFLLVWGRQGR